MFLRTLQRELKATFRQRGTWLNPLVFFVIVISLFPLAVSTDKPLLLAISPGVIWVAALLASLLALPHLFRYDFLDGSLDQLLLQPDSLTWLVCAKVLAHWFSHQLPLIIIAPIAGLFFQLSVQSIWILLLTLFLGTPTITLLGAIIAALTVNLRNSDSILLALLLLPLLIPVLIFATSAVLLAEQGLPVNGQLAMLGAMMVVMICLGPWVISQALKVSTE